MRPDGVSVFAFSHGKPLCWDATCVNTYCESAVNGSAVEAGHAASKAERDKRIKYSNLGDRYRFEPIAIETSGAFGSTTRNIVKEIGKRIAEKTGVKRESMWLKQRLNIAIQRGNALTIISSAKHLSEDN